MGVQNLGVGVLEIMMTSSFSWIPIGKTSMTLKALCSAEMGCDTGANLKGRWAKTFYMRTNTFLLYRSIFFFFYHSAGTFTTTNDRKYWVMELCFYSLYFFLFFIFSPLLKTGRQRAILVRKQGWMKEQVSQKDAGIYILWFLCILVKGEKGFSNKTDAAFYNTMCGMKGRKQKGRCNLEAVSPWVQAYM